MGSNSSTFENPKNQQTQSNPPNPDTKTQDNQNPDGNFESVEGIGKGQNSDNEGQNGSLDEEEGEQKGECGFCLFMKGGGCKEEFIAWEDCIKDKDDEEDAAEKCSQVTDNLFNCMVVNSDYYAPLLKRKDDDNGEKKVNADDGKVEKVNGDGGEEKKEGSEMIVEEKIEVDVDVGKEVVEEKVEVGVGGNEGVKD